MKNQHQPVIQGNAHLPLTTNQEMQLETPSKETLLLLNTREVHHQLTTYNYSKHRDLGKESSHQDEFEEVQSLQQLHKL